MDDFVFVKAYPAADAKTRVLGRDRQCGGLVATALVAAARLGVRCAYAGVLGRDELSEFALARLQQEGIDVRHTHRLARARPIHSTIVVAKQGSTRNIFYDLKGVVGAGAHTPAARLIRSCQVLLADDIGVPGNLRAARIARRAGRAVVGDYERIHHPLFPQLLELTNHLIVSEHFAKLQTGQARPELALEKLMQPDREVVVVTCGANGCWFLARGETKPRHVPAFRVKVTDTTGCGDVFHGAYAVGLVRGLGLIDRLLFAAAAAALKATKAGGQAGIPILPAVEKFLRR